MEVNIIAFGKIADLLPSRAWKMEGISSTSALREKLEKDYPDLKGLPYLIAVDKQIAAGDQPLSPGAEVALLPPYSGG